MHLTLLVPELIWPEPADQIAFGQSTGSALPGPAFGWLAARARFSRQPARAFESSLAAAFGLQDAALASLRLRGENCPPENMAGATWLCADPVHLRFHHERIVLADAGAFDIELTEAQTLADDLNKEFADIGQFHVADAKRWYLKLHAPVEHRSPPLSAVAGRRVDSELPADTAALTRWLNEVQMFLHLHPLNQQRQTSGQPAINSLWLWGGGQDFPNRAAFDHVWSDQVLATGLARHASIDCAPLPARPETILQAGIQRPLLVLDSLLAPVLYENPDEWHQSWQALDSGWFSLIRQQLGRRITTVDLIAPTIFGELHWQLTGSERWKFWKRPRPLADLAHALANDAMPQAPSTSSGAAA